MILLHWLAGPPRLKADIMVLIRLLQILAFNTGGSIWSQSRARNAKLLYRSVRRKGPDTFPAKRLQKQGHNNVLVDCFMKGLNGIVPAGNRQTTINTYPRWNSQREDQKIKWKEGEARLMGNVNLRSN